VNETRFSTLIRSNFSNVLIAISLVFVIVELNQNQENLEKQLLFMEAQAFQARTDSAFAINTLIASNPEFAELLARLEATGFDEENFSKEERDTLFYLVSARKVVVENTHFQAEIGLVPKSFWNTVGVNAIHRTGKAFLEMGISLRPEFAAEIDRVLGPSKSP